MEYHIYLIFTIILEALLIILFIKYLIYHIRKTALINYERNQKRGEKLS